MKVAQEIDVDNVTIIINSDNKLQAVVSNPVEGEPSTFNLINPQFDSKYKLEWVDDIYQVEGTNKFIKGVKLNKVIEQGNNILDIIDNFQSNRTWKELRNVENDSRWGYSGKEYEVETQFTYYINLEDIAQKYYNEDGLDRFINSITDSIDYQLFQNNKSQLEYEQILYILNSSFDIQTVKNTNYVEVLVIEKCKFFLEETYVSNLNDYLFLDNTSGLSLKKNSNAELKTKETYLGVPVFVFYEGRK